MDSVKDDDGLGGGWAESLLGKKAEAAGELSLGLAQGWMALGLSCARLCYQVSELLEK